MGMEFFTQSKPRVLPVIILADVSASMNRIIAGDTVETGEQVFEDGKMWNIVEGGESAIMSLNKSIAGMLETFKNESLIGAEIQVEIITFGYSNATVHTSLQPVKNIIWSDMLAEGETPMGEAFSIVRQLLEDKNKIDGRAYAPAIILISDGEPDQGDNWQEELNLLLSSERAKKADRMAMFIGGDTGEDVLRKFLDDDNKRVFRAEDADNIHEFFKFVTMSVTTRASSKDMNKNEDAEEFFMANN